MFWSKVIDDRHGLAATHLGPKLVGHRIKGKDTTKSIGLLERFEHEEHFLQNEKLTGMTLGTAKSQIHEAKYENARRGHFSRIEAAWQGNGIGIEREVAEDEDVDMLNAGFAVESFPQANLVSTTRLQEIRKYLLAHLQQLALDTMHFTMGEHVFLSHVINSGFENLRAEELRAFLKECNEIKSLFKYV